MSAAAGHLQHIYENRELTFQELKEILTLASAGKLEETTEKFDGMNLMFTWDFVTNSLRVARADGDIKRGGMNSKALSEKFSGRGNISEAFNNAFKVLRGALSALSSTEKQRIFGTSRNRWYSSEVIYTKNPNVINYDCNAVTLHKWPVKSIVGERVVVTDAPEGIEVMLENVNKMQRALSQSAWKISGPRVTQLQKLSNGIFLKESISALDLAMSRAGVTDINTIGDYYRALIHENVLDLMLSQSVSEMVVSRCMEDAYAPTLIDIKKCVNKSEYITVRQFVENYPKLAKEHARHIELVINDFAVELLKGLSSTLIHDTFKEVSRIKEEVQNAIESIESSCSDAAMIILGAQIAKLKSVENITTPMEGVVFVYKGNAYKFTGNFAAVNQILGLFKYGRGETKLKMNS